MQQTKFRQNCRAKSSWLSLLALIGVSVVAAAQGPRLIASDLPEAPSALSVRQERSESPRSPDIAAPNHANIKLLPNLSSYSITDHPAPQTTADKLKLGLASSVSISSIGLSAAKAGLNLSSNSYPAFGQGGIGYSRYLWHGFADQAVENITVQSIFPIVLHQDSRYYAMRTGSVPHRAVYAFSRTLITRTDGGHEAFNASEIIGAGAAAGISMTYYPGQYRTWTETGQRWLGNVLVDSGFMLAREFLPDLTRSIFKHR